MFLKEAPIDAIFRNADRTIGAPVLGYAKQGIKGDSDRRDRKARKPNADLALGTGAPIIVARPLLPSAEMLLPYLQRIDQTRIYSNHGPVDK